MIEAGVHFHTGSTTLFTPAAQRFSHRQHNAFHTGSTTPERGSLVTDGHAVAGTDEKRLKESGLADEFFNGATEWHPIGGALPVRTPVRRRSHQTGTTPSPAKLGNRWVASISCRRRKLLPAQTGICRPSTRLYKGNL
jgi:hypothetical protein